MSSQDKEHETGPSTPTGTQPKASRPKQGKKEKKEQKKMKKMELLSHQHSSYSISFRRVLTNREKRKMKRLFVAAFSDTYVDMKQESKSNLHVMLGSMIEPHLQAVDRHFVLYREGRRRLVGFAILREVQLRSTYLSDGLDKLVAEMRLKGSTPDLIDMVESLRKADAGLDNSFVEVCQFAVDRWRQMDHIGARMMSFIRQEFPDRPLQGMLRRTNAAGLKFYKKIGAKECDFVTPGYDSELYVGLRLESLQDERKRISEEASRQEEDSGASEKEEEEGRADAVLERQKGKARRNLNKGKMREQVV